MYAAHSISILWLIICRYEISFEITIPNNELYFESYLEMNTLFPSFFFFLLILKYDSILLRPPKWL